MPTKTELEEKLATTETRLVAATAELTARDKKDAEKPRSIFDGPAIHEAMIEIFRRVPAIGKNAKNVDSGYAARSIDDVIDVLHTIFAEVGVYVLPSVVGKPEYVTTTNDRGKIVTDVRLRVAYRFVAGDGSEAKIEIAVEGRDWADKATTKALSNALKYGLIQTFLIPLTERGVADPDTETIEVVPGEAPAPVQTSPKNDRVARLFGSGWGDRVRIESVIDRSDHPDWIAKEQVLIACGGDQEAATSLYDGIRQELGYEPTEEIDAEKAKAIVAAITAEPEK